jgi:hypothetical protein
MNIRELLDDRFRVLNELTALAGKFDERGDTQCSAEMMAILESRKAFE